MEVQVLGRHLPRQRVARALLYDDGQVAALVVPPQLRVGRVGALGRGRAAGRATGRLARGDAAALGRRLARQQHRGGAACARLAAQEVCGGGGEAAAGAASRVGGGGGTSAGAAAARARVHATPRGARTLGVWPGRAPGRALARLARPRVGGLWVLPRDLRARVDGRVERAARLLVQPPAVVAAVRRAGGREGWGRAALPQTAVGSAGRARLRPCRRGGHARHGQLGGDARHGVRRGRRAAGRRVRHESAVARAARATTARDLCARSAGERRGAQDERACGGVRG